jgi:hypothetical protein
VTEFQPFSAIAGQSIMKLHVATAPAIVLLLAMPGAHAQAPTLAPVAAFGCENCSDLTLFAGISALAVGPAGEILIADRSAPLVRIFDSQGRSLSSFARSGSGPGELRSPIALARRADKSVHLVDLGRRAVISFDSSGAARQSVQIDGFPTVASFAARDGSVVVGLTGPMNPTMRIVRISDSGKVSPLFEAGERDFPARGAHGMATLSIAVAPDGSFVVGDGAGEYLIRRYSSTGALLSEIRRDIAKVKRTQAELQEMARRRSDEIAKMQAMLGRGGAAPAADVSGIPVERNYFDPYALQFDERGRLWVRAERGSSSDTVFDVFTAAGVYSGELRVDAKIGDFALGAGLLAAVVKSQGGAEQVRVWRVR